MFRADDFDKKMSMRFLQTMNRHLPFKRNTLKELIEEDRPSIRNKDGSTHSFDKKELDKLASMISKEDYDKLRLPIYLEMNTSMERGTIKISGRLECAVINRILEIGRPEGADSMIIYYPHLMKLRKEFSTTTQYMFTVH